ncbi:MAG: right-handed parallel beta-helix repeat-containing protein [Rubrobacteraceae bacterium]
MPITYEYKPLWRTLAAAFVVALGVLAASAAPVFGGQSEPATLVVDDDGQQCPDAGFETIQQAVNEATAGTTIRVCSGTYAEQVTITGTDKNDLQLDGDGPREDVVVQAPDTLADPGDLVTVDGGAQGVVIRDLTISGPLPNSLFCSTELRSGVRVKGGASAEILNNHITEIRSASEDLRGCQNGLAVAVGRGSQGQTGTATVTNNLIDEYQKGGIYADGTGTVLRAKGNEILGIGPTDVIGQNGIQVSRDATGEVIDNNVFDNTYNADVDPGLASGIILFELSGDLLAKKNTLKRNDTNIALYDVDDAKIKRNKANDATFYDGLYVDADSTGNVLNRNRALDNIDLDCNDDSEGEGTAGTANTWKKNIGPDADPAKICRKR